MNTTSATAYWSRLPQVSCCLEGDNAILFDPDTRREKVINATGLILWQAMDGGRDTEQLAAQLASECDRPVSDEIRTDTNDFLQELTRQHYAKTFPSMLSPPLPAETYSRIEEAPRDIDLSLTGKCNLHCHYCFYADEMVGRNDLSVERWVTFFNELKDLAVRNVTLSGGEVFMRPDLFELIDAVIDARLSYGILTNGTLITERTIEEFMRGQRRQRLNTIQVSIDGSCADVHDKSRGKGSFEKAIRGLRLLKDNGFPVTVRVTVNRHNVDDLENTATLLLEDLGLPSFSTNDAMAMGAGCAQQKSIGLLPEQRAIAMRNLVELEKKYKDRIKASAGSLALHRMFSEMEIVRANGISTRGLRMGHLSACGCMFLKLAVHHDGMIAPCNMLAKASLGTIGDTSISSIWQDHPLLKEMRERKKIRMKDLDACKDCEWNPYCNGGCPGTVFTQLGDMYRANPDVCYKQFIQDTGERITIPPLRDAPIS